MKKSEVTRISRELADEIKKIQQKNDMKFVEASREIAKLIKMNRNKKIMEEIIREIRF